METREQQHHLSVGFSKRLLGGLSQQSEKSNPREGNSRERCSGGGHDYTLDVVLNDSALLKEMTISFSDSHYCSPIPLSRQHSGLMLLGGVTRLRPVPSACLQSISCQASSIRPFHLLTSLNQIFVIQPLVFGNHCRLPLYLTISLPSIFFA